MDKYGLNECIHVCVSGTWCECLCVCECVCMCCLYVFMFILYMLVVRGGHKRALRVFPLGLEVQMLCVLALASLIFNVKVL